MFYIPIIVGSTRRDRQSIKVARFVLKKTRERKGVQTELLDLLAIWPRKNAAREYARPTGHHL